MAPTTKTEPTALSKDLLQAFDNVNGYHAGFRPAHAKGVMLTGAFTPSPDALSLTKAPHAQRQSTPVRVRFSDSAGIPTIADNDQNGAGPRGIAIRFHLAEHVHTDLIGHSIDGFPVRTPQEFLELLRAVHASGPDAPKPSPIEAFLGAHPAALALVQAPKPFPVSFAKELYFMVNALRFTNNDGLTRFGRFKIRPDGVSEYLDAAAAAAKGPNYLMDEIAERVAAGPVTLHIFVQLAEAGDVVDDATIHWPDDRVHMEFGTIVLNGKVPGDDPEKRRIIFDPIPRVDGIEPSADPLLEARADLYLASGRRRRGADGK